MSTSARRQKPPAPGLAPEVNQHAASDPKASVWVGASAGSGKTTVLTDRVVRLLLDGVKPQKILCLTFTRAAAAEMANRITGKLGFWATCGEDDLRRSLDDLQGETPKPKQLKDARRLFAHVLSCPGGMRIRTIHAFCQEILGRFPVEADLPPHFAVIDEADAREVIEEVQTDLLHELAKAPDGKLAQALKFLVLDLGQNRFGEAMQDILGARAKLKEATDQAGGIDSLISQIRGYLELAPEETGENLIRSAIGFAVLPQNELRKAAAWLLEGTKSYFLRGKQMLAWFDLPPERRAAAFDDYCRCFFNADGEIYAKLGDKELLQKYPDLDAVLRREAERLMRIKERIATAGIAEITEAVLRLGMEIITRYEARKKAQAALDYDDLIIRTNELLHRRGIAPWVLYKLDGGIDHILIDEAQDTSRAQWSIVKALADEFFGGLGARDSVNRTLFAVGDEKQSIFSFQDADPEAFAEMRNYFARRLDESNKELRPVGLHTSFRSAPAILNAVDGIFASPRAQAGVSMEPIYHFSAHPRAGEDEKIGRVELWPICSAPEKDKDNGGVWQMPGCYEEEHDPQAELAAMIVAKIKTACAAKEILPGTGRVLTPGDFMILLRRRGRFADLMVRALKKNGVPVTGVDRMKLTRQLPVMDLLALMQFALLPEDDLNLATVLRGPLLNASEDQLLELAAGRKSSLWHSLQNNPAFAAMKDYLTGWLNEADFITPFTFLTYVLNEPCPGSAVSGKHALWARLGPDALDPIEELLNAAQDFGTRHAPSMQTFLHWITEADKEIKRELDHGGGEVRIMTVHGAKGLEAPIVFLPDTKGVPRLQDVPNLLWDGDIPIYMPRRPDTGAARNLWNEARRKQMDEYRRLFYVALTRAKNRLYICGWEAAKKDANAGECWYNLAEEGLSSLHEPAAIAEDVPQPVIAFADPELRAKKKELVKEISENPIALPEWAMRTASPEAEIFRAAAPSQILLPPTATPDIVFARGRIIHRLLQSLPDVTDDKRDNIAAKFLANPQHCLTLEQQKEIGDEVLHLLRDPEYAPLFGPESRAEVPMTGIIDGQNIARQADRLCLRKNEVWIVDYKTNRPPPASTEATPLAYRQQLEEYRAILKDIYPGKTVRAFLLWTYGPRLMEL